MFKFHFFLCALLCLFFTASAQRQNTYLLKNNGDYVTEKDSADYIRYVTEPIQGNPLYMVKEYYMDGTEKSEGFSRSIDRIVYDGRRTTFFPNGNIKEKAIFNKGFMIDTVMNYYPNGKLFTIKVYTRLLENAPLSDELNPPFEVITVKDSTGKDLTIHGNGEYIAYNDDFNEILERGQLINGQHEGIWTGKTKETLSTYTEIYKGGKLISGETIDAQNNSYKYTQTYVNPGYRGGIDKFYRYLSHMKYPRSCYKARIQGVALIRFTVQTNGTLGDVKVLNQIHPDMAAAAIRVLEESPPWEAGLLRGKKVKVSYNLPLTFSFR
ncbi:TonB family protein [Pedobacter cryoconitis]|uniref:TonB family protein n=1 Tax=Pedobacter cryoconitis TaxID=188932 RepID=A0A7W9E292_9SPHI|nr:energy transducer TonB [Pedobacter cryoconitis]MBB5638515.1 TonB family protein [Pedobacter cryoconitis]